MPCRDINALNPIAQEACRLFLDECKKSGINVFVTQTLRSAQYQNQLFQQGRTTSGKIVTSLDGYKKKSNHQSGYAWDVAVSPPYDLYDDNILNKAGQVAKRLGITWGGTWTSFIDKPHFEIKSNWKPPKKEHSITKVKVDLFGILGMVDAINIDGFNYVKIRDLNCNQIQVNWNGKDVLVNGKVFKANGIIYENHNYIKIRDLEQVGIKVGWDGNAQTVIVRE